MIRADIYTKNNDVQRHDSKRIIEEYTTKIQWRYDGQDSLIDLGSGCGDILVDFVYPRMPWNRQRIVCSDISVQMVEFARRKYWHLKEMEFRVLNMATHEKLPYDLKGQFDHVTSFYALMWVADQKQALRNIYDLMRPQGGDGLLVALASHPIIDGYKLVSQMEKWSKYTYDLDTLIPMPYQNSKQPALEYERLLNEVGFCDYLVEVQNRTFNYGNLDRFKANMKAVNPFLPRIPAELHEEFMDDVMTMTLKSLAWPMESEDYKDKFVFPYNLLVIYVRK
ncbi:juvenile hormone acid O-methyltransferase-like [Haematobia irritans]|uniref:juvenile hormone acid O-methyltransferase-like n=1 Tax=Haematobia irritans TaxID=7368 RepID=UPI003F50977D